MKTKTMIVTLVMSALMLGGALAQNRLDTRNMSCQQARETINARGAIVMSTGQHTYDRYVASTAQCATGEAAVVTDVPTIDDDRCIVYRCQSVSVGDRIWGN